MLSPDHDGPWQRHRGFEAPLLPVVTKRELKVLGKADEPQPRAEPAKRVAKCQPMGRLRRVAASGMTGSERDQSRVFGRDSPDAACATARNS